MNDPAAVDLRTRILEAATALFAARGYAGTSIREVVEAVGCTKPALYYWFGSKQDLFLACVRLPLDAFRDVLLEVRERSGTARERLAALADAIREGAALHPDAMRIVMTSTQRPEPGQPLVDLHSMHQEYFGCLLSVLEDGTRAGEVRADIPLPSMALAFIGVLHTRIIASLELEPDVPAPPWDTAALVDLFFSGARAQEPAP